MPVHPTQAFRHPCVPPSVVMSRSSSPAALPATPLPCRRNLSRETAWEAVMRIRCSKGLRVSAFFGHFFIRSTGEGTVHGGKGC